MPSESKGIEKPPKSTSTDTQSICTVSTDIDIENNIKSEKKLELQEEKTSEESSKFGSCGIERYLGLIYTLLSTAAFSLASTILKKYSRTHPFNFGTWAFPLAAGVSVPFLVYRGFVQRKPLVAEFWPINSTPEHRKTFLFIVARTLLSSHIAYVLVWALQYISVGDLRTILAASVISVFFVGWLFLGEKCGVVPWVVALLALLGIGVMTRPPVLTGKSAFDTNTLVGVSLSLLALVLVTFIIAIVRFLQNVHHSVLNFILYFWASVQSLLYAVIFNKLELPATIGVGLAMSSAGILMALGNLFIVLALQRELAGVVSLIRTSEVIFTFGWQWIIIGLAPDYISIIGAVLVLSGVIVVILRKWVESLPNEDKRRETFKFLLY